MRDFHSQRMRLRSKHEERACATSGILRKDASRRRIDFAYELPSVRVADSTPDKSA